MLEEIQTQLPAEQAAILARAAAFLPRAQAWKLSLNRSIKPVKHKRRPMAQDFNRSAIEMAAREENLPVLSTSYGYICYHHDCKDFALLVDWTWRSRLSVSIKHFITGICLGYPVQDVIAFSSKFEQSDVAVTKNPFNMVPA